MNQPIELKPHQFTDRLQPIFEHVLVKEAKVPFDSSFFFPRWRHYMELGLARTWESTDSVLGAFITSDLFFPRLRAQIVFWFALPSVRKTKITGELFDVFETAAKKEGCVDVLAAAYHNLTADDRAAGYIAHGFHQTEQVFTKTL